MAYQFRRIIADFDCLAVTQPSRVQSSYLDVAV